MTLDDMSRYKDLFISEAQEHVEKINAALLELEQDPAAQAALEQTFRSVHSLKGMAGTMGYTNLSRLAHSLEDLLDQVRQEKTPITPALMDLLFAGVDAIQTLINDIAADRPPSLDVDDFLKCIAAHEKTPAPAPPSVPLPPGGMRVHVTLADDCLMKSVRAFMVLERLREHGRILGCSPPEEALAQDQFGREFTVVLETDDSPQEIADRVRNIAEVVAVNVETGEQAVPSPAPSAAASPPPPPREPRLPTLTHQVRVDVERLDSLINLVGELVINHSRLKQAVRSGHLDMVAEDLLTQERILEQLQEAVLQVRAVPVALVFDRFPRMVRDLLRQQGKEADLIIEGREMELDRMILERLTDALIHLLRNAVDHGLETPEEREKQGKPRRGTIRLTARREGGMAVIEVTDDGRGLSRERITAEAVRRDLITPEHAQDLSDQDIYMLICAPGFSLAEKVTEVSGRGVGMDVVKRQVEALRGSLEIISQEGQGTTFRLRVPLSLAIVPALLVSVGSETYAIPANYVERTVAVDPAAVRRLHRWEMLVEDGNEVIPLWRLGQLLEVPDYRSEKAAYAIVVRRGQQPMGLMVDSLQRTEEIVVKPLGPLLNQIPILGGATILGSGEVVLILDIPHLVQELQ